MAKSVLFYDDCDVYMNNNDIEIHGYHKNTTFGEMIDKALENKCCVIIKNGKGKWYLKGLDKDYVITKEKLEKNVGKYPRSKCWLIEF
jgi:hypothetical protein